MGGGIYNWQQGVGIVALMSFVVLLQAANLKEQQANLHGPASSPVVNALGGAKRKAPTRRASEPASSSWTLPDIPNPLVALPPIAWALLAGGGIASLGVAGALAIARREEEEEVPVELDGPAH